MIHRAQLVWRDDDWSGAQRQNQITRIKIFTERTQQTARAFDKQNIELFPRRADVLEDLRKLHRFFFEPSGERGRNRRTEMPRIDFIKRECAVQRC